jgi:hypothetical protein
VEAGIGGDVLRAVAEAAPRERRAVAITALTVLHAQGHVPEQALQRVREALARGPDALANLPAQAAAARRRGPPTDVARPAGGPPAGAPPAAPSPGARGAGRGRPDTSS